MQGTDGKNGRDETRELTERLAALRARIDRLDTAMVYILAERFHCTEEIGMIKRDADLPALDPAREDAQRARLAELARDANIDYETVEAFFSLVTARVRRRHQEIKERD